FYFLKPDLFGFLKSIDMLVIVVLGGLGSLTGSVVSAIFLTIATALMQGLGFLRMIVYALLLISIMLFRPKGIMGTRDATDFFPFQKREQGAK
ncbi:MAG: branched-chain amino acid ABC transporter permease, partial [Eubacteriaceae bacterium]|nr:branched-chain amino acid ABC transporter permease [Eubacteriaceae bacterium]